MTPADQKPSGGRFPFWRASAIVLLGCALVCGLLLVLRSPKTPPPSGEVLRSALNLRDGRLYHHGSAEPFTGVMIEPGENGRLLSRSSVSNGLLEGLSEGWHTNGQKQVEEHFRAGVSHGLRTKWHANGRKLSEAMVVDGKLDGTFRRWHEDGSLSEVIEMKQGQADGLAQAYYPSGSLKAEAQLHNGQVREQKHWKDGEYTRPTLAGN